MKVSGDLFGVHESTVSRIIKRVSIALASLYKQYVKFTSGNKVQEIQRQFMQQSRIPGIVGAIDCTYIPIQSPGGVRQNRRFVYYQLFLFYCQPTQLILSFLIQ